jgi:hypothetical protein
VSVQGTPRVVWSRSRATTQRFSEVESTLNPRWIQLPKVFFEMTDQEFEWVRVHAQRNAERATARATRRRNLEAFREESTRVWSAIAREVRAAAKAYNAFAKAPRCASRSSGSMSRVSVFTSSGLTRRRLPKGYFARGSSSSSERGCYGAAAAFQRVHSAIMKSASSSRSSGVHCSAGSISYSGVKSTPRSSLS